MKRLVSMALLVAALLSATVSASAKGRKGDFRRGKRGDFRQEIRFHGNCPKAAEMRRWEAKREMECRNMVRVGEFRRFDGPRDFRFERGPRDDFRFHDGRFDKKHHCHHGKRLHRH